MTSIANRYHLQREIGSGAMGTVFVGEDTQTGQAVAIKRLKAEITSHELVERFRREGAALRELNHPNIVKLLDTIEEAGQHFLIIDYVAGGDLRSLIEREGQLSIERTLNIALDLADALTRAHRLHIIHRDLKPANVLLAEDGTPRLTDFGVAHFADAQAVTEIGVMIGTLGYLAPEALQGAPIDERTDIWAFGVMVFEMVTGKRPFVGQLPAQVMMATLSQSTPDIETERPDCPIALQDLIYRMLEKDPNARIRSVRLIGADLEAILHGHETQTVSLPPDKRFATPTPEIIRAKHNLPAQTTPFVGRESELVELAQLLNDPQIRLLTILAPGGMGKTRLALELASQYIEDTVRAHHAAPLHSHMQDGVFFVDLSPLGSFDDQLLSTLQQFIYMLRSGYSVIQAFQFLAENAPEPTASASHAFLTDMKNGFNPPQALRAMRERVKSKYVGQLVDIMLKQFGEGGNLADRLDEFGDGLKHELGDKRWSNKEDYTQGLIVPGIAAAIDFQFQGDDQKAQLLQFLHHQKLLLVLDNFEHLVDGASLVTDMLTAAPHMQIIVTSRQRLGQPGETLFHLSGMDFPDWETPEDALQFAAVKLFMNSARRAQPNFELTVANMDYVARICKLVHGMPLGIVLAAAWLAMLSPQEIAVELQHGMDILESEFGDVLERHKNIRAVLHYSWNMMNEVEQQIFIKLAVFRGGFTRQAGQAITGANLQQLMSLVNKSLIRRDNDSGRYEIHELLRQYAAEKAEQSGLTEVIGDAHMTYYANVMREHANHLTGHHQLEALNDITSDFENVYAAWTWAVQHERYEAIDQMPESLCRYCNMSVRYEAGITLFDMAVQRLSGSEETTYAALRGRLLTRLGFLHHWAGHTQEAHKLAEAGLQIAREQGKPHEIAVALHVLSSATSQLGQTQQAWTLAEESLLLFREIGDRYGEASILHFLIYLAAGRLGQYEQGEQLALEALNIYREIGNKWGISSILMSLGVLEHSNHRRFDRAEAYLRESLAIGRELHLLERIRRILGNLVALYCSQGRLDEAEKAASEAVFVARAANHRPAIIDSLSQIASIKSYRQDYEAALKFIAEAQALVQPDDDPSIGGGVQLAHGMVLCAKGDYAAAEKALIAALHGIAPGAEALQLLECVLAFSLVLAFHQQQAERALAIASMVAHHPLSSWWDNDKLAKRLVIHFQLTLSTDVYAAAWEQGKSLDLETVVKELLDQFSVN